MTIIGLDGATWEIAAPLCRQGRLPNLQALLEAGVSGPLRSTIHPLSPQAWCSFMTGKNPGKHGIYEFVEHKPDSYELCYINGEMRRGASLWRLLSEAGKRVCVINVPVTYPPEPVNGILVAGFDAPSESSPFIHPPEVNEELRRRFGRYQIKQHPYNAVPETYLDRILEGTRFWLEVAAYLKAREPWDLFVVVFDGTDLVQHFYWHYYEPEKFGLGETPPPRLARAIFDVYGALDAALGRLLSLSAEPETVLVMSDHGAGPCPSVIFLDRWLHQNGYLHYAQDNGSLAPRLRSASHRLLRSAYGRLQRHSPALIKQVLNARLLGLKQRMRSYLTFSSIDWTRTRAYSLGIDSTNIFFNLKGRFPLGQVAPGSEYESLRDEIAERLGQLADPRTGEPVVERIFRREELYHGECLEKAPDLLVLWKRFEYCTRRGYGLEEGPLFGSSLKVSDVSEYSALEKSGTHTLEGVLAARGPHLKRGARIEEAQIIDLAPTVLHLLGEPVPSDMDGRVLEGALDPGWLKGHPVRYRDVKAGGEPTGGYRYSDQEEEQIRRRLESLGYVE